jgi:hypothetical protein
MIEKIDGRERRQQTDHSRQADEPKIVRVHDAIVHG